ncbi:hypothetical protein [Sulfitobacter sp. S190]|uniref:hypothetical protein n=1 Tax=Sulfitobacter sp. S190 TaxID=2867022 RepID=UPI0021A7ACE4|nr:hypothetical protein [Sulfitobacter sp. S190]UWR24630.1 hypothetical protein K3756_19110 [Sulfitobacter sp. S190]
MNTGVLRVLRAEAASYWRHRALRRDGQVDQARRLEREVIRRNLRHLRTARTNPNAYVSCTKDGTILHLGLTTVSNYAPIERFPLATLAVALGMPFVDLRPVNEMAALAKLPRVTMDGAVEAALPGQQSKVDLLTYLDLVEQLGATIATDPRGKRDT